MDNSHILTNPSKNELIKVFDQFNLYMWRTTIEKSDILKKNPNSGITVEPDILKFISGINHSFLNVICNLNITEDEIKDKIRNVVNLSKRENFPLIWWVGTIPKPQNLGDYLVNEGFIKAESPGMYLNLNDIDEIKYKETLNQPQISIERVSTPKQEKQWFDIFSSVFGMEEFREEVGRIFQVWFQFCDAYLATHEGKPVGISQVFYCEGVSGIYSVGVCPEYRNRGIGKALTIAPLLQAKKKGCEISILTASKLGFSVYHHIGFKECCKFYMYIFKPANK